MYLAGEANIIAVNGTFVIELVAFIAMIALLWRYAYPQIAKVAEGRQKVIADQLAQAELRSREAEERLKDAEAKLNDARAQAQEVIAGAARSGAASYPARCTAATRHDGRVRAGSHTTSARALLADTLAASTPLSCINACSMMPAHPAQ